MLLFRGRDDRPALLGRQVRAEAEAQHDLAAHRVAAVRRGSPLRERPAPGGSDRVGMAGPGAFLAGSDVSGTGELGQLAVDLAARETALDGHAARCRGDDIAARRGTVMKHSEDHRGRRVQRHSGRFADTLCDCPLEPCVIFRRLLSRRAAVPPRVALRCGMVTVGPSDVFGQSAFHVRFEWGLDGARALLATDARSGKSSYSSIRRRVLATWPHPSRCAASRAFASHHASSSS